MREKAKEIQDYSTSDFVSYFKCQFDKVYGVPYVITNVVRDGNYMKRVVSIFYAKGLDNEEIAKFLNFEIDKYYTKNKVLSISLLIYGVTPYLFELKRKAQEQDSKFDFKKLAAQEKELWDK